MTSPVPFAILRAAYQHALDTEADNLASDQAAFRAAITTETAGPVPPIYRAQDYWPGPIALTDCNGASITHLRLIRAGVYEASIGDRHVGEVYASADQIQRAGLESLVAPATSVKVATKDKQP